MGGVKSLENTCLLLIATENSHTQYATISFLSRFDGLIPNSKTSLAMKDAMAEDLEMQNAGHGQSGSVEQIASSELFEYQLFSPKKTIQSLSAGRYKHGQYPEAGISGTFGAANRGRKIPQRLIDDHHSPITPEKYLQIRVAPLLAFYQERLPFYSRMRFFFESALVLGSMSGTVLAFLSLSKWAAVPAALTAAVAAYSEFHGTEKKLLRYSDSIANLDSVLMWWRTLTDVEKASVENKNKLVSTCEQTFQSERQAWVSTSMSNKMLMEESTSTRVEATDFSGGLGDSEKSGRG